MKCLRLLTNDTWSCIGSTFSLTLAVQLRIPFILNCYSPQEINYSHAQTAIYNSHCIVPTLHILGVKVKGRVLPRTGHEGPEEEQMYSSTLPSTSALDGGGWSTPRPGRFTPGKDPVPIVLEAGWAPGPVLTRTKNLAPTGIRSPDRPAHNESLYRLSHRDPLILQGF